MAKEAYYFSHDSNARHDPKIMGMRSVYGLMGYAWFWIIVEMLRESDGYKLEMRSKYAFHAFASQMQCEVEKAQEFIEDCIHEFCLFEADETYFWSPSLKRRMLKKQNVSDKARKSAEARWGKKTEVNQGVSASDDAKDMQTECERIEKSCDSDALKESKGKEIKKKVKEIKDKTAFEDYTSNPTLLDMLQSFIEFRKKIKKPMTDKAITLLLGQLDKLATDDATKISVLEQSIVNGWQGVFPLKDNGAQAGRGFFKGASGKPQIPIVAESKGESTSISAERLEELRQLGRKVEQQDKDLPF